MTLQGVWTGEIAADECVVLEPHGLTTGEVGEQASMNVSIASSQLLNGGANLDPVSENDFGSFSLPIIESADLALETRIIELTLSSGSNVSYEVYLNNVASGPLSDNMVGVFFIMPEGATFSDVQNPDVSSPLSLLGCQSMGMVAEIAPSLVAYNGELIQCAFSSIGLPGNSSTRIIFNMNAGVAFTSGETKVYGVALALAGGEAESMQFVAAIESGQDGFALGLNNIFELTYDDGDLSPIINRCTGVNENVSIDDACFTVTFNKQIWQDSFEQSDLVLDGGGTIYSFVQDSPTQWTVRINGMTLGGTLRLLLNEESVEDYSNVKNGVQVLGENLIRYGVEDETVDNSSNSNNGNDSGTTATTKPAQGKVQSKSASGVLASTGAKESSKLAYAAMIYLLGGFALYGITLLFKPKKI